MIRHWRSPLPLLLLVILTCVNVFAQDPTPEQLYAINAARIAQEQARYDALNNSTKSGQGLFDDFPNPNLPTPVRKTPSGIRLKEFQEAVPKFRESIAEYRWMLSQDGKLDKPLRLMKTQIDILLRSWTPSKTKRPDPDFSEFKTYTRTELQWETLNSAETIDASLDVVAKLESQSESQDVVSLQAQELRYQFYEALQRLKWLATHIS